MVAATKCRTGSWLHETKQQRNLSGLTTWFVAIAGLSALVGVLNAENPRANKPENSLRITGIRTVAHAEKPQQATKLEQIESTLAQAGCPGWIVLASEGETALEAPTTLVPKDVQKTVLRVDGEVPRVSYPTPLRVASRNLIATAVAEGAQLTTSSADDPDDLLDGVPDLLAVPAGEESEDADEPTDTEPADSEAEDPTPAENPPSDSQPAGSQPAEADAPATEPVFPGPSLPKAEPATPPNRP